MTNFENSPPSATSARARRRQRREPLQFYTVAAVAESHSAGATPQKSPPAPAVVLRTQKKAAKLLKISRSWLAKARMRGDGPPYIKFGKSIRYPEAALLEWLKVPPSPLRQTRT